MSRVELSDQPIDVGLMIEATRRPDAGACAVFVGTVRDHAQGRSVRAIDYSAYVPMAERVLNTIADECGLRWPQAQVRIAHRLGHLVVGDDAVAIVVSCPHRAEAFEACRYVIERIKEDCPIWKKEWGDDGASWVSPRP